MIHNTRNRPKGYYFLTPVWGEAYTRLFMNTAIPAQLAPGNLPVFADSKHSRYVIFTTPKDEEIIRSAPAFKQLSDIITVVIEYINDTITVPHDLMSDCHKRGIVMADAADAAALFLNPDLVFADGSFRTVRRLAEEGRDVILVTGIRTLKQGVMSTLLQHFKPDGTLCMSSRALMQTALNHLHPLGDSSWWEEKEENDLIPANLYWRAGQEGIVARCFHLHPLMVYPQHKGVVFFGTVDDDYVAAACPDARYDYVVTDSDELLAIELSDPGRAFLTGFRKKSIDDTVVWAEQFTNARHRSYFDAVIRMHVGVRDAEVWAKAKQKSDEVVNTVKARMSLSAWKLLITNSPALQRRLIRWSQDYELQRVNRRGYIRQLYVPVQKETFSFLSEHRKKLDMDIQQRIASSATALQSSLKETFIASLKETLAGIWAIFLGLLSTIPARLFLYYVRLVRKLANTLAGIKITVYGPYWYPYPWVWRYHYVSQLRMAMSDTLKSCDENTLIIAHDVKQSSAVDCWGGKAQSGIIVTDANEVRIISHHTSRPVAEASCQTIVIERALSHMRQMDSMIRETARILKPGGKLILLVNRLPSPSDRMESEICVTGSAAAHLLKPEFEIHSQTTQGAFSQGLIRYVLDWVKLQSSRLHFPFLLMAPLSIVLIPINIMVAFMVNGIIFLLDKLDTTGRYYISSITVATKVAQD